MTKTLLKNLLIPALLLISGALYASPKVEISTNIGNFIIELDDQNAPKSTANFLNYVDKGFYNGTIFHRVIRGFMIQGGGYTADLTQKPTEAPIPSEAQNGLKNQIYTVSMARLSNPDSATSQFFINIRDNDRLNYPNIGGNGYAVFGKVIAGMDVVDLIGQSPTSGATTKTGSPLTDVPVSAVTINSIKKITDAEVKSFGITQTSSPSNSSVKSDSLQDSKQKCLDLGFKDKTEAFGKCVLRLSK